MTWLYDTSPASSSQTAPATAMMEMELELEMMMRWYVNGWTAEDGKSVINGEKDELNVKCDVYLFTFI